MLYFAYGSNLDAEQMARRCPRARIFQPATLRDYALCFVGYSAARHGAVASVKYRKGSSTVGLVYTIDAKDLRSLDSFEGHPFVYERNRRAVVLDSGKRAVAEVYQHLDQFTFGPGQKYLEIIDRAYRDIGFDRRVLARAAKGKS